MIHFIISRKLDEHNNINISWHDLLNGGFAAATVLVSFGVVIGKTTPMQLLGMASVEVPLFVANSYIGYSLIGAVDVGGAIFIHTFGAYFGLFVRLVCIHLIVKDCKSYICSIFIKYEFSI